MIWGDSKGSDVEIPTPAVFAQGGCGNSHPNFTAAEKIWDAILSTHRLSASFLFSLSIFAFALFYAPQKPAATMNEASDVFQMVNVDEIVLPKRSANRALDSDAESETSEVVERAEGLSESEEAVDLAFFPNVVPPRPIGRLKKIYPEEGRSREVEATVIVRLVIDEQGRVLEAHSVHILLSKALPAVAADELKLRFGEAAVEIMAQARFTPPIIDGQKRAIVMEMPLRFELN